MGSGLWDFKTRATPACDQTCNPPDMSMSEHRRKSEQRITDVFQPSVSRNLIVCEIEFPTQLAPNTERRHDVCIFCVNVKTINSTGCVTASPIVTLRIPFWMSVAVIVVPRPTETQYASVGLAPANAPCFHIFVGKFSSIAVSVAYVLASLASNTNASQAILADCSIRIIVLRK